MGSYIKDARGARGARGHGARGRSTGSGLAMQYVNERPDPTKHVLSFDGHPLSVTASVGVAIFPDGTDDCEVLIARADSAMYRAKLAGGGTFKYGCES